MSNKRLRAVLAQAGALVLGGAVFLVTPARGVEPAPAPDNSFTCRASVVRTENSSIAANIEPFTANEEGGECKDDAAALVGPTQDVELPADLGTLRVPYAQTDDDTNTATAGVANLNLTVAGVNVTAEVLTSRATAGACPSPGLDGSSEIVNVTVSGPVNQAVDVPAAADDEVDLPIPGVGGLYLNYQTESGGVLTKRALFLDVNQESAFPPLDAVPDIIVAEAIADIHGDPCVEGPPDHPNCEDGADNDGDGLTDRADPDCQEPENPANENCADGLDNDGDGLVDDQDPDCQVPVDEGRCPPRSPEGQDSTPDKDCGQGQPSDVTKNPKDR